MNDVLIPATFRDLVQSFSVVFTEPSFQNFTALMLGWIRCNGRHTIAQVLRGGPSVQWGKHFSVYYRFFARAVWNPDEVGRVLFGLLLPQIPGLHLYAIVDDTLCRRSGPHLWGAGMHFDPLRSTYGRGGAARWITTTFGHNWVTLAIWVPLPWGVQRGIAVPVLWRLYQSKKYSPDGTYRKRTELAAELLEVFRGWVPEGRQVVVLGDAEYACKTVLRTLPAHMEFIGPLPMNAALYDFPRRQPRRGRRRIKGRRLPTPLQLAENRKIRWRKATLVLYGQEVRTRIKVLRVLWPRSCGSRPVQVVVTRDPQGRLADRAYLTTLVEWSPEDVLAGFARRWTLEVAFRDAKQGMGLEDPQNGWWRRPSGSRRPRQKPGPQARGTRGERAVRRTVPLVFSAYGLVIAWYLRYGKPMEDVSRVRRLCPWYRHKRHPSFGDMLSAARREVWAARFCAHPYLRGLRENVRDLIPVWLAA